MVCSPGPFMSQHIIYVKCADNFTIIHTGDIKFNLFSALGMLFCIWHFALQHTVFYKCGEDDKKWELLYRFKFIGFINENISNNMYNIIKLIIQPYHIILNKQYFISTKTYLYKSSLRPDKQHTCRFITYHHPWYITWPMQE